MSLDATIVREVNQWVGRSPSWDAFVLWLSSAAIAKGALFAAVLWALWCGSPAERVRGRREILLTTGVAALLAELLARVLALSLPYRARPIHEPSLQFVPPQGIDEHVLKGWSSFPSDHAVMFFALATGIALASRVAGAWMFALAVVVISLPRLYLGLHYPSDLLAGALIGIGVVLALQRPALRAVLARPFLQWEARAPVSFYAVAWIFTFDMARMFESLRGLYKLLRGA